MSNLTHPNDTPQPITAQCQACGQKITSQRGGHYRACDCGESFIDRDRWFPDRVRLGGQAELLEENND